MLLLLLNPELLKDKYSLGVGTSMPHSDEENDGYPRLYLELVRDEKSEPQSARISHENDYDYFLVYDPNQRVYKLEYTTTVITDIFPTKKSNSTFKYNKLINNSPYYYYYFFLQGRLSTGHHCQQNEVASQAGRRIKIRDRSHIKHSHHHHHYYHRPPPTPTLPTTTTSSNNSNNNNVGTWARVEPHPEYSANGPYQMQIRLACSSSSSSTFPRGLHRARY